MKQEEFKLEFNGKHLFDVFVCGAHRIMENQQELNKINVFPVPDADTGSNIANTVSYVLNHTQPIESFKKMIDNIAENAIMGARGNSGIIFAQFLYGISKETEDTPTMGLHKLTSILKKAVQYVYSALSKPVEGTMITTIREWTESLSFVKSGKEAVLHALKGSYHTLENSLLKTREKLEALKNANVVDAGGKAFFYFIDGIWSYIQTGKKPEIDSSEWEVQKIEIEETLTDNLTYRYCTEGLIEGYNLNTNDIRHKIENIGDSLVIAGSDKKTRIHIHTNQPPLLFQQLRTFGTLTYQKADDMRLQYQTSHERKYDIALVTDSACDLPQHIMEKYQIHQVPINLFFGDNHYLDKLTITPEIFYEMLDEAEEFPKTAQPNLPVFTTLYKRLSHYYSGIVAIHLGSKLSGTWENSRRAAEQVMTQKEVPIHVLDSGTLSGSLGLMVLRAAELIDNGMDLSDIQREVESYKLKNRIMVSVKTLRYMIKGGRVSPMKGFLAKALNLKPIVSIDENGNSIIYDKAFSQKGSIRRVLKRVGHFISENKLRNYCILHAHNLNEAENYAKIMTEITGINPLFIQNISTVIGLSAGVGSVAVALMAD